MLNKKVVVAGHICLDITPVFPKNKIQKLHELLVPGKLVLMGDVDIHTGGVVANTGLAMKVLGADVKLMGKVGKDAFGELLLGILGKYSASEGMIVSDTSMTSYSIIISAPGNDRVFLHNPGSNDTFCYDDLNMDKIKDAALFHFGYPPLMKKIYENDGNELVRIFREVKRLGVMTSLDMAAVDPNSEAGKVDWSLIIRKVIPYVDFFVPSIEELGFMTDRTRYEEWVRQADGGDITSFISIDKDVKPLAHKLIEWGAKCVLVKCGATGMYLKTASLEEFRYSGDSFADSNIALEDWVDKEIFENSYEPECVLSATGAGDTSIAAFLTAVLEGYNPKKCLQLATATGAYCVSTYDAISGLLPLDVLNQKIEAGWKKHIKNEIE